MGHRLENGWLRKRLKGSTPLPSANDASSLTLAALEQMREQ